MVINIFVLKGKKTILPPTGTPSKIQIMHVVILSQSTHNQSFRKKKKKFDAFTSYLQKLENLENRTNVPNM